MSDPTIEQVQPGTVIEENVSFEDFVRRYEGQQVEWHTGKVVQKISKDRVHQSILTMLNTVVGLYLAYKQAGRIYTDGYPMRITDDQPARQPDILVVLNEHADRLQHQYLDGPADFVLEIISPSTGSIDRGEKYYEYQNAGVPEYWIVDPLSKRVDGYYLEDEGHYQRISSYEGQIVSRVLPGFKLDAALLWREELPQGDEIVKPVQAMQQ